jgi:hypothetical protein
MLSLIGGFSKAIGSFRPLDLSTKDPVDQQLQQRGCVAICARSRCFLARLVALVAGLREYRGR